MKSRSVRIWVATVAVPLLIWCAGCAKSEVQAEEVPVFTKETSKVKDSPQAPATHPNQDKPVADTNTPPAEPAVSVVQKPTTPKSLPMTPALAEVIKLAQAGLSEDVILAYITNSTTVYEINSDHIVYLNDLGVSSSVITALIKRDNSPDSLERKRLATAASPLPPGVALNTPATNIFYYTPGANQAQPTTQVAPEAAPAPVDGAAPPAPENASTATVALQAPAQAPASVSYFYESLAPYGSWVDVDGYGLCWQPTVSVANPSWRPYADQGRWYWTDAGWYWYSDYSWGWAPFHYGRWHSSSRVGWVWVPDTVWGSSWVTWRYSGSHCGWAPLPPYSHYVNGFGLVYRNRSISVGFGFGYSAFDYTFCPWNRFYDHSPYRHYAGRHEKSVIYKNSTVVNNYIVGDNNTIINDGVGVSRASSRVGTEITRVPVRTASLFAGSAARQERLVSEGSGTAVVRPLLPVKPAAGRGSDDQRSIRSGFQPKVSSGSPAAGVSAVPAVVNDNAVPAVAPAPRNIGDPVAPRTTKPANPPIKSIFGGGGRAQRSGSANIADKETGVAQPAATVEPAPSTTAPAPKSAFGTPAQSARSSDAGGRVARAPFESVPKTSRTVPVWPSAPTASPNLSPAPNKFQNPTVPRQSGNGAFAQPGFGSSARVNPPAQRQQFHQPSSAFRAPAPINNSPAPIAAPRQAPAPSYRAPSPGPAISAPQQSAPANQPSMFHRSAPAAAQQAPAQNAPSRPAARSGFNRNNSQGNN